MPSRFRSIALSTAAAITVLAAGHPSSSPAHHPEPGSAEAHLTEDYVVHSDAEEAFLEQRTEALTAADAAAAAASVVDDPARVGQWGPVEPWPVVGVHVALLRNGKVLAHDSVGDKGSESYEVHDFSRATVWDPETHSHTAANVATGFNIFCSGLAHLVDGSLFVAGGNKNAQLQGIEQTHVFDSRTSTWSRETDMEWPRWYPTVTPLRDGEMLITDGGPHIPEVRELDGDIRSLDTAALDLPEYPWIDVAPDGRAFVSGPDPAMWSLDPSGGGSWQSHGERDSLDRSYGGHAYFDTGKILVAGGGESTDTARVIDLNGPTPQVTSTGRMETGRRQHNLTVLADGEVLATGGNSSGGSVDLDNSVFTAELWKPSSGQWRTLAAMEVTRQYHSAALLLPDGRVLSSGGGVCGYCDTVGYLAKNAEVFSPPYLFEDDGSGDLADRPEIISAPNVVAYDEPFPVSTPNAGSIGKVALVRLGAVTHSVNMEQRYVPLSFDAAGGTVTADAPANANIAPPGVYMLFVMNADGVPSMAKMVRVATTAPAPPPAPSITATVPGSPANDVSPEVTGTGAQARSTVKIFSTATCSGIPLASGSAASFNGSAGLTIGVPANTTTNLRATATDDDGTASACSAPFAYAEDSTLPTTPTISDTDPASPANDNAPEVEGSGAEAGSTVRIYGDPTCSGPVLGSGSAASFNGPGGITTAVTDDRVTNLRVTATDASANKSGCSAAFAYAEDSTPPDTAAQVALDGTAATVALDSEPGATFECRLDGEAFSGCEPPQLYSSLVVGEHSVEARATDPAGNTDPTPAELTFAVAPLLPLLDLTAPDTTIAVWPKREGTKRKARFRFVSSEANPTFTCRLDGRARQCGGILSLRVSRGRHTLEVAAADASGNTDPSPAFHSWKVERSRR